MPQVHLTRELTTPSGEQVHIDRGMTTLVQALWDWGATTLQSCQDAGASILNGGWDHYPIEHRARYGRFWDSYAWLQLTHPDGLRLADLTEDLAHGSHWECSIPLRPGRTVPVVNLFFPNWQIGDMERAVRRATHDDYQNRRSPAPVLL